MSTAYINRKEALDLTAKILNETPASRFIERCPVKPGRPLLKNVGPVETLLNWVAFSLHKDHGKDVRTARTLAKVMVHRGFTNASARVNLAGEWRQYSWWALRLIADATGQPLPSADDWTEWKRRHGLIDSRSPAPECKTEIPDEWRDEQPDYRSGGAGDAGSADEDGDGDKPERSGSDSPTSEGGDSDGKGDSDGEGDPEKGDSSEGGPSDGEPDGDPEEGEGKEAPGEGSEDGEDREGSESDETEEEEDSLPENIPEEREEDGLPETIPEDELPDERSLLGYVLRTCNLGIRKVRAKEDDKSVVSGILMGPAGVGKTRAIRIAAEMLGAAVFVITAGDRRYDYLGYRDSTTYHKSVLIKAQEYAAENPNQLVIILFDELDMVPADTSGCIFSVLNDRTLETIHTGVRYFPKNIVFFAAMNTMGNGANDDFVGRTPVDKALLDRFSLPFVAQVEEKIAREICRDDNLVDLVLDWNQACRETQLTKMVLSYRTLNHFAQAREAGFSIKYAVGGLICMGQTRSDLETVWGSLKQNKTRKYWQIVKECIEEVPLDRE